MKKIRVTMLKAKGQLQPGRSYNLDPSIAESLIQQGVAEGPKHPEPIAPKETPVAGPSEFKRKEPMFMGVDLASGPDRTATYPKPRKTKKNV